MIVIIIIIIVIIILSINEFINIIISINNLTLL